MTQPLGKVIVMAAFDEDDEGNLQPAFDPREFNDGPRQEGSSDHSREACGRYRLASDG